MNKKIIYWSLVGLLGVNLFLVLTGLVIPWLISTNQIPLAGIIFLVTTIVVGIVTFICCLVNRAAKKDDSAIITIPCGCNVEVEMSGTGGGSGGSAPKTAKVKVKATGHKAGGRSRK